MSLINKRILCLGDSLTAGQFVSPHLNWVTLLAMANPESLIVNAGRNGETTAGCLDRLDDELRWHAYHITIIQYGLNDCNLWKQHHGLPRVSPESFRANLAMIIERLKRAAVDKIILTTNHLTNKTYEFAPGAHHANLIPQYNEVIREVAGLHGGHLVSLSDLNHKTIDGIHLNEQGHIAAFYKVNEALNA